MVLLLQTEVFDSFLKQFSKVQLWCTLKYNHLSDIESMHAKNEGFNKKSTIYITNGHATVAIQIRSVGW